MQKMTGMQILMMEFAVDAGEMETELKDAQAIWLGYDALIPPMDLEI